MGSKSEPCPKCRKDGRDTRGDNMQRWPDGHAHCFACQYHEWLGPDGKFAASGTMANDEERKWIAKQTDKEHTIKLPADAVETIDYQALTWLAKYDIEMDEVKQYKMCWSPSKQMLIFPFYADGYEMDHPKGKLMGWQARCFNSNYTNKYYKVGGFTEFYNVLNIQDGKGDDVIIVEDFLSAIKLARRYTSMALLGSNLSSIRIKNMAEYTQHLTFWLDEDKAEKAYSLAQKARMLQFHSKFIITKHDPKEYTNEQIQTIIETHSQKDSRLV